MLTVTTAIAAGSSAVLPSSAGAAGGATARAVAPSAGADSYEARVQYWVNRKRAAHGLRPVRFEACTDAAAEVWARYLATSRQFYHQSMRRVMSDCGASWAAETLAVGRVRPRGIVRMWMRSPGHRAVVLSKAPGRIGIGASLDRSGRWVVAADFTRF